MKPLASVCVDARRGGFTLVELLVACSILALLVVLVAQMVASASSVTGSSKKRLDADDEARLVFDRLAGDIGGMVKRRDINPLFLASNGNDAFYFYSQAPAYSAGALSTNNSQLALIGYSVSDSGVGLLRFSAGQSWDALRFEDPSLTTITTTSSTNFHVIAPDVFRMEYALLMKPGSVNNTNGLGPVTAGTLSTNGTNVFFKTNNAGQAMKDVSGIIVAIALLDPTSRVIVTTNSLTTLAAPAQMPDTSATGILVDLWQTSARNSSGIPLAPRSQIRVYQRYFPINQ
jgi:prepilin-type N-terminal cleavage/methylation domain-containing protein